jgi:hypothetical protein
VAREVGHLRNCEKSLQDCSADNVLRLSASGLEERQRLLASIEDAQVNPALRADRALATELLARGDWGFENESAALQV